MVAFLTVRSVVVSFAFRGGSAFCDGAACVVSDDDAVPAMVPSLLRRSSCLMSFSMENR